MHIRLIRSVNRNKEVWLIFSDNERNSINTKIYKKISYRKLIDYFMIIIDDIH